MNQIKFLGTGGGRFVVMQQVRKSGGIWVSLDDTNVLVDPGPGSLTRVTSSRPKLNPLKLDGIILTHRHIDHSNDVNIMIEAMTNGGHRKKGVVFAPRDALDDDPVVLKHFRQHLEKIEVLKENSSYQIGQISFSTPVKHVHNVETYGLNFFGKKHSISIISDTKYFNNLESYYKGEILIIYVVLKETKNNILHLGFKDAERIISVNKPRLTVLTHFGMNMIKAKPWEQTERLSKKLGCKILAATDGMSINLDKTINTS